MRLLVPYDFSPNAETAFEQACYIAAATNASIEVLHITNPKVYREYPISWPRGEGFEALLQVELEKAVLRYTPEEFKGKLEVKATVKNSILVSPAVTSHYLETKPDLIVMGTHGFDFPSDKLLGSNTSTMINHSMYPILAVPDDYLPGPLENGIASIQLQDLEEYLPTIKYWASTFKASIDIVQFSAVPSAETVPNVEIDPATNVRVTGVLEMVPELSLAENIAQYAEAHEKVFCMMFVHERTWLQKLFNGSVSERVSGIIQVPLLAIPTRAMKK